MATNYSMSPEQLERQAKHGETWHAYPDDKPLHSLALKGDSRAALVPFLAHKCALHYFPLMSPTIEIVPRGTVLNEETCMTSVILPMGAALK